MREAIQLDIGGQSVEVVAYKNGGKVSVCVNGVGGACVWRALIDPKDGTVYGEDGKHIVYRGVVLRPVANPHPNFPDALDLWVGGEHFEADDLETAREIIDEVLGVAKAA